MDEYNKDRMDQQTDMSMKMVKNKLLVQFIAVVAGAMIIIFLGESGMIPSGVFVDDGKVIEFYLTTIMELMTLASIFMTLRLFKIKKVHQDLIANQAMALSKWGVIRISMLEIPLLVNGVLYYLFMQTSFGYMGIILLLCMPFVFPTMERCIEETTEKQGKPTHADSGDVRAETPATGDKTKEE